MTDNYLTTGNPTVSVMIPWDCKNNCPFCVSKKEYQTYEMNVDRVRNSLDKMLRNNYWCDVVFTGGEPLANLSELNNLLNIVKIKQADNKSRHHVYINTSLPPSSTAEFGRLCSWLKENESYIDGLNISHHLKNWTHTTDDFDEKLEILNELTSVRLNCVLYGNPTRVEIVDYINKYAYNYNYKIQFRKDYTTVTEENLYQFDSDRYYRLFKELSEEVKCPNVKIEGSNFRWNYRFLPNCSYHVTLPYSTMEVMHEGEYYQHINDIIIRPNGDITTDWNDYGEKLDIEKWRSRERL